MTAHIGITAYASTRVWTTALPHTRASNIGKRGSSCSGPCSRNTMQQPRSTHHRRLASRRCGRRQEKERQGGAEQRRATQEEMKPPLIGHDAAGTPYFFDLPATLAPQTKQRALPLCPRPRLLFFSSSSPTNAQALSTSVALPRSLCSHANPKDLIAFTPLRGISTSLVYRNFRLLHPNKPPFELSLLALRARP